MTQCSDLHSQCLSGVFELANRICRLFNEPLVELEAGNIKDIVSFMKISLMAIKSLKIGTCVKELAIARFSKPLVQIFCFFYKKIVSLYFYVHVNS